MNEWPLATKVSLNLLAKSLSHRNKNKLLGLTLPEVARARGYAEKFLGPVSKI